MVQHHDVDPQVCVIGRTSFNTGIGAFAHAAAELFSRHAPTAFIPTDRSPGDVGPVMLPSGRVLPVCTDPTDIGIFFFADVLDNGAADVNLSRMPGHGIHIAHFCFDSDELPLEWVYRLNEHFELAYVPTESQRDLAVGSGVRIPVGVLPIALPLEQLLGAPPRTPQGTVRFGAVTAFHERKELGTLVAAFQAAFAGRDDVELVVHSNLAFGDEYRRVAAMLSSAGALPRVELRHDELTAEARDALIASFDVFVNCSRGEGYSIGAREALAAGAALVLSDIGVHRELQRAPGVFLADPGRSVPAHYPEIDHRIIGRQTRPDAESLKDRLMEACEFVRSPEHATTAPERRGVATAFTFDRLSVEYATVIDPDAERTRLGLAARRSPATAHPDEAAEIVRRRPRYGSGPAWKDRLVIQAHDGGFYSVFNAYMSHLTWGLLDDRCHMVLPDWDQSRLIDREGTDERESFCYGKYSDGNIWTHLFEPPFGTTVDQMNDVEFLYARATIPESHFNARREPMLTYRHAYDLYRTPTFPHIRRQYHEAYRRHIHLRVDLEREIRAFLDESVSGRRLLAAHVKHPSHVIEQPEALMAAQDTYFEYVEEYLAEIGIPTSSDDWRLFLGTDQQAVVNTFVERYGEHVITFPEIRRSTADEDALYTSVIAGESSGLAGYQVQNLVAASPDNWSLDMARDILRDSNALASAEVLFHVVSNVATAASYINPSMRMAFVSPR